VIYFDTTNTRCARHHSGLVRVARRLLCALGEEARPVFWKNGRWQAGDDGAFTGFKGADWLLTAELFSEEERPGITEFLARKSVRTAAIFHDAIPLRLPDVTWPKSVARQVPYMELLAGFDRVLAVSSASRDELMGFWRWQGRSRQPDVTAITLGADFDGAQRAAAGTGDGGLLCVGILEPRKNQLFLAKVCAELWRAGADFDLHVVGRVNPHFGKPVERELRRMKREFPRLYYHAAIGDDALAGLYARARATVFPTIAEGCGLPLLESLWRGVPCVASDLPSLRENAAGGGCVLLPVNDHAAWVAALGRVLKGDEGKKLAAEASSRALPRWSDTAAEVVVALRTNGAGG
jgi:glycosyltransferase involved in cell wall biosynthesis